MASESHRGGFIEIRPRSHVFASLSILLERGVIGTGLMGPGLKACVLSGREWQLMMLGQVSLFPTVTLSS